MSIFIYIPVLITLILMSISDLVKREIPHTLTLILLSLGIINGITNEQFVLFNWLVFIVISVFLVFSFYLLDKMNKPIGGGDIKMICISMLFLSTTQEYFTYLIAMLCFNFLCVIISLLQNETSGIKYGPYLSLALITPMTLFFIVDINICISLIASLTVFFLFLQTYFHLKEVVENVELFKK